MKFIINPMEKKIDFSIRTCPSCLRELHVEDFYINRKTQAPDYICKDCRSAANKKRYLNSLPVNEARTYPVITDTQDRALRMELLLRARRLVNESIARKRRILREAATD